MKTRKTKTATGRVGLPTTEDRVMSFEEIEAKNLFEKFNCQSREEYISKIDKMTDFDLSTHAQTVGVRPVSERSRIRVALLAAFENAKGRAGSISRAAAVESTSVKRQIEDNYESFIAQFRPA